MDGCDRSVILKDRRAWEGISHAKTPKIVAYLGPLKMANFMPSPRPTPASPPRPRRVAHDLQYNGGDHRDLKELGVTHTHTHTSRVGPTSQPNIQCVS